jgi:NADH dehydrogenase/NADH:ubiquinone oxidoreductase subunit G
MTTKDNPPWLENLRLANKAREEERRKTFPMKLEKFELLEEKKEQEEKEKKSLQKPPILSEEEQEEAEEAEEVEEIPKRQESNIERPKKRKRERRYKSKRVKKKHKYEQQDLLPKEVQNDNLQTNITTKKEVPQNTTFFQTMSQHAISFGGYFTAMLLVHSLRRVYQSYTLFSQETLSKNSGDEVFKTTNDPYQNVTLYQ